MALPLASRSWGRVRSDETLAGGSPSLRHVNGYRALPGQLHLHCAHDVRDPCSLKRYESGVMELPRTASFASAPIYRRCRRRKVKRYRRVLLRYIPYMTKRDLSERDNSLGAALLYSDTMVCYSQCVIRHIFLTRTRESGVLGNKQFDRFRFRKQRFSIPRFVWAP